MPDDGAAPLAQWRDVVVDYAAVGAWGRTDTVRALHGVSLNLAVGESLGVVGESGSGKSTLGRALLRLVPVTSGSVWLQGRDLTHLSPRSLQPLRQHMQVVFQDPGATLDPRWPIVDTVAEPAQLHLRLSKPHAIERARELLLSVGLSGSAVQAKPGALSGGQRQRVALARALACAPRLLVLDEPLTALDATVQAQIINLLRVLRHQHGLAYLLICHDLAAVSHLCDRVAVLHAGRVVECGLVEQVLDRPQHLYTQQLVRSQLVGSQLVRSQLGTLSVGAPRDG